MTEIFEILCPDGARSLSDMMTALERAAVGHAIDLRIDHDRMLADYGCLWMVVRCRLVLSRLPAGAFTVKTWLRRPTAAVSNRDFSIFDDAGECGTAVQTWVLADEKERRIVPMKSVAALWELPTPIPERTGALKRINLPPDMADSAQWEISPSLIDGNGHLNNVAYVRRAEALVPAGCTGLEVIFDRECFAGETLTLQTATGDGTFVRGVKAGGDESFRARFWRDL